MMYQKTSLTTPEERYKMKEETVNKYLELKHRRDYYTTILMRGVHLEVDQMYTRETLVPKAMIDSFKTQLETYFKLQIFELEKQIEAL